MRPLSSVLVKHVMAELGLDRLRVHSTIIVARKVVMPHGFWLLGPDAETIAVGASDARPFGAIFLVALALGTLLSVLSAVIPDAEEE